MLRTLIFALGLIIMTVCGAIVVITIGFFKSYASFSYNYVVRPWAKMLMFLSGSTVEVVGSEHVTPGETYVLISNHQSHMDIPALFGYLPMKTTVIAKRELFKIPVFAQGMRAIGVFEVDRANRNQAFNTLQKAAAAIKRHHISLLAFAEGTRSLDGQLRPFKKGAFVLAINTQIPILPITITGTLPILPKGKLRVRGGNVRIQIHEPIPVEHLEYDNRNNLIKQVQENIASGIHENAEVT